MRGEKDTAEEALVHRRPLSRMMTPMRAILPAVVAFAATNGFAVCAAQDIAPSASPDVAPPDVAPPVAHLTADTGADLIAYKLTCPSCDLPSKSELLLGEQCEPAHDPLQIDVAPSSSAFSEMGIFDLAPGEYAEITTIDPAGKAKSCLSTMEGCQD